MIVTVICHAIVIGVNACIDQFIGDSKGGPGGAKAPPVKK